MKQKRKIFVVGNSTDYANWLEGELVKSIEEADIVLFTGGEDVCPTLYNEPIGRYTSYNSARDKQETAVFEEALRMGKHMLGICRGSQLLCVLSGGRLVQHQENRHGQHPIILTNIYGFSKQPPSIMMTSTHHQAQFPFELPAKYYRMLAYSTTESKYHLDGEGKEMFKDPQNGVTEAEIVVYPHTKCLGIQGHPEYIYGAEGYDATFRFLYELMEKFMEDKF